MEASLKKVIFTCGGTAGHVNPAIALAQLMREKDPETEFLFVGAERGLEKDLIPKAGYEFRTVHISSFHRSLKPAEIKHNLVSLYNMVRSPASTGPSSLGRSGTTWSLWGTSFGRPERPGPFCGSSGRTWSSERGDTPASLW